MGNVTILGTIGLILPAFSEQYTWQKVTTCVHNLLSLQKRWIENYGTMLVKCISTNLSCSVELRKTGYWSTPKYEITGDIINECGLKVSIYNLSSSVISLFIMYTDFYGFHIHKHMHHDVITLHEATKLKLIS